MITIRIPGPPQGKGRARTVKKGSFTHSYTPKNTALYENLIKVLAMQEMEKTGARMIDGPVKMIIEAYYEIPKSTSKRQRAEMERGIKKPCKKPDVDNIVKAAGDALNGVAYRDDVQICDLRIIKRYTTSDINSQVIISIEEDSDIEEDLERLIC